MQGFVILLFAAAVAGCYSTSGSDVPGRLKVEAGAPAGYVALSMGGRRIEGQLPPFQEHALRFRAVGERSGGRVSTFVKGYDLGYDHGFDVADGEWFVDSVAVRLPPGQYEIHALEMRSTTGTFTQTLLPDVAFSIPFEVRDGRVTYLGSFVGHSVMGRNTFGMEVRAGAYFAVFDERKRDIDFLVAKGSLPGDLAIDSAVIRSPVAEGLFQPR
jgi:hypothetical protein